MKRTALALSLLISLTSCFSGRQSESAPEIEAELIDGTPFKLSTLRGNYVLLDFWGSWCGPCMAEFPELLALYDKYGEQVIFVSVALEKNDKRWRSVSEKAGFRWKHQIVEEAKVVLGSPIARDYGVIDIPSKFIITPEGKLISGMNFVQMDAYLAATLPKNQP